MGLRRRYLWYQQRDPLMTEYSYNMTKLGFLPQPADPYLRHLVLADADDDMRDVDGEWDDAVLRS